MFNSIDVRKFNDVLQKKKDFSIFKLVFNIILQRGWYIFHIYICHTYIQHRKLLLFLTIVDKFTLK